MNVISPSHQIMDPLDETEILTKLELCGRTAYKSEDKITHGSAEKFIKSILKRGHESVIEHVNISVRFICDRGVTHELVRHRLVAYTQESTRYCDYTGKGVTFIRPFFWELSSQKYIQWSRSMDNAELAYTRLIANGASPQEARSILPNSLKTEIVCTANIREWRHIMRLRTSNAAHPQMRELMRPLLVELREKLPVLFNDVGDLE